MSRYGMGRIVFTVLVVAVAATHSSLSSYQTMDLAKRAVAEFSDEQRSRIFDGVMGISDAPVTEVAAPEVAKLFAGRRCQCRICLTTSSMRSRWFAVINS